MLGARVRASRHAPPEQLEAGGLVRHAAWHPAAWRRVEGLADAHRERLLTIRSVNVTGAEARFHLLVDSAADLVL
eukprot:3217745-Pyramimonas_sp.AAC.1